MRRRYKLGPYGTIRNVRTAGSDEAAVQRLFSYLFKRVEALTLNLHIIVTEYTNLDAPDYQRTLVEEPCVGGIGLVPAEWLIAW